MKVIRKGGCVKIKNKIYSTVGAISLIFTPITIVSCSNNNSHSSPISVGVDKLDLSTSEKLYNLPIGWNSLILEYTKSLWKRQSQ